MRRCFLIAVICLGIGGPPCSATSSHDRPTTGAAASPIPKINLFFTDEILARMKMRIEREDWARRIWDTRLQTARDWVALKMEIPKTGGGYFHSYACSDDGARLRFDPRRPHEHYCPTCKRYLTGPKLDAYWVAIVHSNNIQTAKTLALNARLFNKSEDAQWAKTILLYYARHYEEYPVHGDAAGRGKIFYQSLDESVNMLEAVAAYESLAPGGLSPDEARTIREQWIRPAAQLVSQFRFRVHNIQCWHAAFLLVAGLICEDNKMTIGALASLEENLVKGITPDGWWFEGSPGYHFYTLSAMSRSAIPAGITKVTPPHMPRMIEMLTTPFRVAYPNLDLPAINDSGVIGLGGLAPFLETATFVFDDPRAVSTLSRLYEIGKAQRTSFEALCYGPDSLTKGQPFVQRSERLDHAGMMILRRPRANLYALLRSGRFQGGHDHPDRLNLILYGLDQPLAPDLGVCGYGLPLAEWYRSTVAHNTLVIDEKSQDRRASDAECVFFRDEPDFAAAAVRATQLYPGVEMSRTVVALDDALIDYCCVRSDKEHTVDWVYRNTGRLVADLPAATSATTLPRYPHLEEVKALTSKGRATVEWKVNGGRVVVTLLELDKAGVFSARGLGFPGEKKLSLILVRRHGQSADFVNVIQIVPDGRQPRPAEVAQHLKDRVVVRLGDQEYELAVRSASRVP
jgi:hypothetical protein